MKRAILALCLPVALSGCAYVHGSHHVELERHESVLVDYNITKVAADASMQKAVEICNHFNKKPLLSSTTPGSNLPGKPAVLQADFYRCM